MPLEQVIFSHENAVRRALESLRWPDGTKCPHCGSDQVASIGGKLRSHRDGLFRCTACRGQFTVTVGTVFHRSKVPLTKWLQIIHWENSNAMAETTAWEMAEASGLTYKTVQRMLERVNSALKGYDGPNKIFGRKITRRISERRPEPPKVTVDWNGEPNYRRWYAWRRKHPLGPAIIADGSLAAFVEGKAVKNLDSTEKLVRHLLRTPTGGAKPRGPPAQP
jgi:transposase-like protein